MNPSSCRLMASSTSCLAVIDAIPWPPVREPEILPEDSRVVIRHLVHAAKLGRAKERSGMLGDECLLPRDLIEVVQELDCLRRRVWGHGRGRGRCRREGKEERSADC